VTTTHEHQSYAPKGNAVARMVFFCCALKFCFASAYGQSTPQRPAQPGKVLPGQNTAAPRKIKTAKPENYFYTKARAYFEAGAYAKAIQYAAADIRRNPARMVSRSLMAQAYYRLGMVGRSASIFAVIGLEDVPMDAIFEYELAMFSAKKYRQASAAWQRLPDDHPYKDIAKFYSGVSFLQLRQYAKASNLLRSAKKLPANLRSERRRLLAEIDQYLDQERAGYYSSEQAYAYQPAPVYNYAPPVQPPPTSMGPAQPVPPQSPFADKNKPAQKPDAKAPAAAQTPPPPPTGFIFSGTPTFTYESATDKLDRNGYRSEDTQLTIPQASLPMKFKYAGKPKKFGGQPTLSLDLTPGYDHTDVTINTSELTASADNPTNVQNVTTKTELKAYNQTLKASLEGFYPVSDPLDVSLAYRSDHVYVDASEKKDISDSGPTGKVTFEADSIKVDTVMSMIDTNDAGQSLLGKTTKIKSVTTMQGVLTRSGESSVTKIDVTSAETKSELETGIKSSLVAKLNWDKTFNDFGLGLGGLFASKSPYENSVIEKQFPKSEQSALVTLKYQFPFNIGSTAGLSYTQFDGLEYLAAGPPPVVYSTAGTAISYNLLLNLPIFGSYGGIDVSYRYTDRKITPSDDVPAATQLAILKALWSQKTTTSLKLTLKYPL
jgi:tetratricopeptide (TPR) repeat protein